MSIHFTDKEFNWIESAIQDTACDRQWLDYARELDLEFIPEYFLENVTRNPDGTVDVPENMMPTLAEMLHDLHIAYAECLLLVGMECEHDDNLIEDFMQELDCLCQATSIVMRNPGYIRLMKSYRIKRKHQS